MTAGPQSKILEGINWDEAQSLKVSFGDHRFPERNYIDILFNRSACKSVTLWNSICGERELFDMQLIFAVVNNSYFTTDAILYSAVEVVQKCEL